MRAYQSRLPIFIDGLEDSILSQYASLAGRVERSLFARLQAGDSETAIKREFIKRFGITARQFNAASTQLEGKVSSVRSRRPGNIEELEQRIARAKKVLKRIKDPAKLHQKKRRLNILQTRLAQLKSDHASDKVRLCFGSRKLFRSQFYLKENGYTSHDEWKKDWQQARANQFFVIGSKDEASGCQSCVATVNSDNTIKLRLRLPPALSDHGKYLVLDNIRFQYGHEQIVAAIGRNLSSDRDDRQAINYRFVRDEKGWRVFVSVAVPEVASRCKTDTGVIGIDINANHLAVTETDRYGNPVNYFIVPCNTYGRSTRQRQAIIGDAVKQVVAYAVCRSKPIVTETLDFQKKKAALERQSKKYARMLSSLAYAQIQAILRARAFDAGIEVYEVNPAYTSVIGQYKFTKRYGISTHNAAALVIGRRYMGFSERLPSQLHGTLPLPVRNRGKHVWSKWAVVLRITLAALAAHRRSRKGSLPSPAVTVGSKARLETNPPVAGETPAC